MLRLVWREVRTEENLIYYCTTAVPACAIIPLTRTDHSGYHTPMTSFTTYLYSQGLARDPGFLFPESKKRLCVCSPNRNHSNQSNHQNQPPDHCYWPNYYRFTQKQRGILCGAIRANQTILVQRTAQQQYQLDCRCSDTLRCSMDSHSHSPPNQLWQRTSMPTIHTDNSTGKWRLRLNYMVSSLRKIP